MDNLKNLIPHMQSQQAGNNGFDVMGNLNKLLPQLPNITQGVIKPWKPPGGFWGDSLTFKRSQDDYAAQNSQWLQYLLSMMGQQTGQDRDYGKWREEFDWRKKIYDDQERERKMSAYYNRKGGGGTNFMYLHDLIGGGLGGGSSSSGDNNNNSSESYIGSPSKDPTTHYTLSPDWKKAESQMPDLSTNLSTDIASMLAKYKF